MKKIVALILSAALALSLAACGAIPFAGLAERSVEAPAGSGESLEAWSSEAGWTAFYTFTQNEKLEDAWEAAAEAFGPVIGIKDLTGAGLKALNVQVCGLEDDIVRFEFDGSTVTAVNSEGGAVFSRPYTYVATIENAIEGAAVYVYQAEEPDAGKYTYLCMTAPAVESEEGGVMTYFRLRYAAADYEALFAEDYAGVTGVMVDSSVSEEELDYTIRLLYGAPAAQ